MAYVKDSFIAISDFHSTDTLLYKMINHYLDEYEYIYILGDVTDRGPNKDGTGGIKLLNSIRTLSQLYPDRIRYIPGNHDWFLYRYAMGDKSQEANLLHNGGARTKFDIDWLEKNNPKELASIINWLGSQPLQCIHGFNGKVYGLAHAFFNQTAYMKYPNLCLKDEDRLDNNFKEKFMDILWFRKENQGYDKSDVPRANIEVIVGHTPLVYRKGANLDLKNEYGETVKVHCVDGGLSYTGDMLKYDGGDTEIKTIDGSHYDTSPKPNLNNNEASLYNAEKLLNEIVIQTILENVDMTEAYDIIYEMFKNFDRNYVPVTNNLRNRAHILTKEKVQKILDRFIEENKDNELVDQDSGLNVYSYIIYTAMDYIYSCLLVRYGFKEQAQDNLLCYLNSGELSYMTSHGNARMIAKRIGLDNLKKVSPKHIDKISNELEITNKFRI